MISRRMLIASASALAACSPRQGAGADDPWRRADEILARIQAPEFPDADFLITDYGAASDGETWNTQPIADAIAACYEAGGGRVVVPAGEWLSGPIHLKSNVNLHLAEGSTILFSTNPDDYLPVVFTRWEGIELMNYSPLVYAFEQENIAITGSGTLDGRSTTKNWWPWKDREFAGWREGQPSQREARAVLFQMAEDNVPVEERVFGDGGYLRPNFIQPYRCTNVLLEGVTLRGSPMWQVHPVLCTNITMRGMTIIGLGEEGIYGPNTDGCDPESVTDMLIEDCFFDCGDDCIAVNSGRNADGRRVGVPASNIIIRNNRMARGHGGITVGSQISGGAHHVFAENCVLDSPELDSAIRFKNNALRGGLLENFYYRNLTIGEVGRAVISIEFNYEEGPNGPFTPRLHNLVVENVTCEKTNRPLYVSAFEGADIDGITIRGCTFKTAETPSQIEFVENLTVTDTTVNGEISDLT